MPQGVQITLSVKDDGTAVIRKVSGELKSLEKAATGGASRMSEAWSGLKARWVEVAAVGLTVKKAFDLASEAASFNETVGRLNTQLAQYGTTAEAVVPAIQAVVNGQLSLAQASETASRGLAAGFDPTQIRTLAGLAEGLADQMGGTIQSSFEQLTQAISTGMFRSLKQVSAFAPAIDQIDKEMKVLADSTGRTVDQLTEGEKRFIALNAVMGESKSIMAALGGEAVTMNDRFQAFNAQLDDTKLRLGQGLIAAGIGAVALFQLLAGGLASVYAEALNLTGFIPKLTDAIGLSNGEFERTRIGYHAAKLAAQDLFQDAYQNGILATEQLRKVIDPLGESQKKAGNTAEVSALQHHALTNTMQLQAKTIQGPLQEALKSAISHFESLQKSAKEGLKALSRDQVSESFSALPDIASQLQFIQSAGSNVPAGGTERIEGLKQLKDMLNQVAGASRTSAAALGEAQAKLTDLERQRTALTGQGLGSADALFPSVENLRALESQKTALDSNIESQRALVQSMQAAGPAVSETIASWTASLNNELRTAWKDVETTASNSLLTARSLLKENIDSASEFQTVLGLIAQTPDIRLRITGLDMALLQAERLLLVMQLVAGSTQGIQSQTVTVATPSSAPTGEFFGPGFASGGSFTVPGSGGTDSQLVRFKASPGERVTVQTPGQQQRGQGMTVNIPITVNGSLLGSADALASMIRDKILPEIRRVAVNQGGF